MASTMIQALREYFSQCPQMSGDQINPEILPDDLQTVPITIDAVPAEFSKTHYHNGGGREEFIFVIQTKESYEQAVLQKIDNCGFYQEVERWVRKQKSAKNFPQCPGNYTPLSMEARGTQYEFGAGEDVAKYQILCCIMYYIAM